MACGLSRSIGYNISLTLEAQYSIPKDLTTSWWKFGTHWESSELLLPSTSQMLFSDGTQLLLWFVEIVSLGKDHHKLQWLPLLLPKLSLMSLKRTESIQTFSLSFKEELTLDQEWSMTKESLWFPSLDQLVSEKSSDKRSMKDSETAFSSSEVTMPQSSWMMPTSKWPLKHALSLQLVHVVKDAHLWEDFWYTKRFTTPLSKNSSRLTHQSRSVTHWKKEPFAAHWTQL